MAGKTEKRRAALRKNLISIADQVVRTEGLSALKARDLAQKAGCSVGAIYNVFGDLNDLILEVNAQIFRDLGQAVTDALENAPDDPVPQLVAMARAYHKFAETNRKAWRAIFAMRWPGGESAPDWYLHDMAALLARIDGPLAQLFPDLSNTDRALMTRTLFSSVHGIVVLGLNDDSAGVPRNEIDRMIALLLQRLTR